MRKTSNYKLHLTDDDSERFIDWRNAINGIGESNMVIIDRVLGEKASKSTSVEAVLLPSAWAGKTAPYTQEIEIDGMSAIQNGSISVAHTASPEQRQAARDAILSVVGQSDNRLVIAADGEMPELDIPVFIVLLS